MRAMLELGSLGTAAIGSAGHMTLAAPRVSSSSQNAPRLRPVVIAATSRGSSGATVAPTNGGSNSGSSSAADRRERVIRTGDMVATSTATGTSINYKLRPNGSRVPEGGNAGGPVRDFVDKLWMAWQIFFPEKPPELSPKDGAKQRLRMILVADRCGMSPTGMAEMKKNILKALEEFVDIESEEQIDVSISLEPEVGTIYMVAVPVRRVKPEARAGLEGGELDGMAVLEWDPADKESDPSSRFPMGC